MGFRFFGVLLVVISFCGSAVALSLEEVRGVLREISEPGVDPQALAIEIEDTPAVFLSTRRGTLFVHSHLLSHPPPKDALKAILVHEMFHLNDFASMNWWEYGRLGLNYFLSSSFESRYERWTDLRTLCRGFRPGLAHYREWLYGQLNGPDIALKKINYFTPEEIGSFDDNACRSLGLLNNLF